MSKRKHPEEPSIVLSEVLNEAPVVNLVEESVELTVVRGRTIGEETTAAEEEETVSAVDLELEREEGWEAEPFWELLTRAGYECR